MKEFISRESVIELCSELQGKTSSREEMKGISKVWKEVKKLPANYDLNNVLDKLKEYASECFNNQDLSGGIKVHECIKIVEEGIKEI